MINLWDGGSGSTYSGHYADSGLEEHMFYSIFAMMFSLTIAIRFCKSYARCFCSIWKGLLGANDIRVLVALTHVKRRHAQSQKQRHVLAQSPTRIAIPYKGTFIVLQLLKLYSYQHRHSHSRTVLRARYQSVPTIKSVLPTQ